MDALLNQREIKNKRKLFSVYTVYLVSGMVILLWALQTTLAVNHLWPFGPSEPWMILFILVWTLSILKLLFFLPFIIKTLNRSMKPYSLSIPAILAVVFVGVSLSVMVPMLIHPLRAPNPLFNVMFAVTALGFSVSGMSCGVYGLRKLRKNDWSVLNPTKEDLVGIRGPAKVLYWLYILSGIFMLLLHVQIYLEDSKWSRFFGYVWTARFVSILNLLLLAIPFVYLFHFWFLRYVIRHFTKVPDLSIPLLLMVLFYAGFFSFEKMDFQIFQLLFAVVVMIVGLWGLYNFKRRFPQSN